MAEQTRPDPTPESEPAPVQEPGQSPASAQGPDRTPSSTLPDSRLEGVLRAARRISIIATDRDGVIQVFNSGAEHMLGYTAEEMVGRKTPMVFHLDAEMDAYARELTARLGRPVRGHESLVAQVVAGGPEAYDAREWTYVRKDGRPVPVHLTITGLYTPAGEREGILGVGVDLTEQKALEADLRQAQASVDNAQDMIFWAAAEDGRYTYVNEAATRHLGYSREELLAMSVVDLNPVRTPENWRETVRLLRAQKRHVWRGEFRRKDGGLLPVEFNASLIRHEGRDYVLGVVRDTSERLALEASLRQAQLSVDRAGDMILWLNVSDARIRYANEAACRALGYSREELLALQTFNISPRRTPENWRAACDLVRAAGQATYETLFRTKDGRNLPVEVNGSLVEHQGQEFLLAIIRDLSERKQAEERLQGELLLNRSLARVARALISAEPDLAAISKTLLEGAREVTGSRYGNVSVIDQDTGELFPHTMTSMPPGEQCPVLDRPAVLRPGPDGAYPGLWGRGLNTGQGFIDNDRAASPLARPLPQGHAPVRQILAVPAVAKGRVVGQIALANPDRDYGGADLAAAEALADLFALGVEQILSRRALLEAKEAAEASSRAKGEFLANMTHEVRTPLNGVLGMLQVLQSTALDQEQQESVRVALESAERLHLLLTNILEFARLDSAPGAPPECLIFPPTDLLHALAATTAPRARAKGLDFSAAAEPGLPEFIRSDPAALRQCLGHLLDNAVKFTPTGMVRLGVGPAQGQDGQPRVAFRVEDTGIGIPADKGEAVFAAFAQADASFTRTYGGAGLGLAIARRLARRLGGDITAQNRPGGGTVMTLTILADNSPPAGV